MSYDLKFFNSKNLDEYVYFLYCKNSDAKHIPFKPVLVQDRQPLQNKCHHNVSNYVEDHPTCKPLYGWLCIDEEDSDCIIFLSHSVVQNKSDIFDITPSNALIPRPFIDSFLTDEVFITLVEDKGITRLVYKKQKI